MSVLKDPLYRPLDDDHIRVLKLDGTCVVASGFMNTKVDVAIQCTLLSVSLDQIKSGQISYRALSYTWGYPQAPRKIVCNGHERFVTQNLYDALWQFTNAHNAVPHYLWADAICVNQNDIVEKSKQVSMMNEIFRESELVLVWLGSGAGSAVDLFDEKAWERSDRNCDAENETSEVKESSFDIATPIWDLSAWDKVIADLKAERRLESIQSFILKSEWCQRIWTFQEIALARDAQVHCGPFYIAWQRMIDTKEQESYFGVPSDSSQLRSLHSDYRDPQLSKLLQATSNRRSTKPLDTIYGLLGLYRPSARLKVDYSQSVLQVCATVTAIVAEEIGRLYLRTEENRDHFFEEKDSWESFTLKISSNPSPVSWIPDWTERVPRQTLSEAQNSRDYSFIHPSFQQDFFIKDTTLVARGVLLGQWNSNSSQIGHFEGFPKCVHSGAARRTQEHLDRYSQVVGDASSEKTTCLSASAINQIWRNHRCGLCPCIDSLPLKCNFDKLGASEPWLCIIFGCPDLLVVQELGRSTEKARFAILGILGRKTGWGRALKDISKGKDLDTMELVSPEGQQLPQHLRLTASSGFARAEIVKMPLDDREFDSNQRLSWIPTCFEIDGDYPQERFGLWQTIELKDQTTKDFQAAAIFNENVRGERWERIHRSEMSRPKQKRG